MTKCGRRQWANNSSTVLMILAYKGSNIKKNFILYQQPRENKNITLIATLRLTNLGELF